MVLKCLIWLSVRTVVSSFITNYNVPVAVINGHQEMMSYQQYALILNAKVLTGISQDRTKQRMVR